MRARATECLEAKISDWAKVSDLRERICIYTTGSFGRSGACSYSDLDVFIVALEENVTQERRLSRLEEIELLASIVHTNRELGLPELDGDGGFLKVHQLEDYLKGLGKPHDDADNTFTGRLLLLLESKPIFGTTPYQLVRRECVLRYWTDYSDHSDSFLPAFLVNDILRFWRTLCVNYEAGTTLNPARRRAKNYKLKFSRLLTCFSAIVGIQAQFQQGGTVSAEEVIEILDRTPLERLRRIGDQLGGVVSNRITDLEELYDGFLRETNCSKHDLYGKMEDPDYYKRSLSGAREFGDVFFDLIQLLSVTEPMSDNGRRFFRYITI